MSHTLKIGDEPVIPGLALPKAFEALDKRLESTVRLGQLKGSPEGQTLGVITVCQELERLLKLAFIENGMLASRIEILTRYHIETMKKWEKKMSEMDVEHKVTRKHMKRLRKRLIVYEIQQKKNREHWWEIDVSTSDYDSVLTLSRTTGAPDLDFMLRVNQLMIDFVNDKDRNELILPPMGNEERQELSKLASVYKLRCRFGKSVNVASSTLIKARQSTLPAPGEVDAVLENFAKMQRRQNMNESIGYEEAKSGVPTKDTKKQSPDRPSTPELPSTMLTPLSSTALPLLEFPATNKTPVTSPPTSGLGTPTDCPTTKPLKEAASTSAADTTPSASSSQEKSAMGESPLPPYGGQLRSKMDHLKPSGASSDHSPHGGDSGVSIVTATTLPQHPSQLKPPPLVFSSQSPHSFSHHTSSMLSSTGSSSGSRLMHHQRPLIGQPTVLASPLKLPISHLHDLSAEAKRELERRGEHGTISGAPPPKRTRMSRRNTSSGGED